MIKEGLAEILSVQGEKAQKVFYNECQVFNRDLSIIVLNAFAELRKQNGGKDIRILEALAASGLRSIRYWKEVEHVESICVNDLDATAVEHIRNNLKHNGVPEDKVTAQQGDANSHMYKTISKVDRKYDVIDIDPYGTAAPFLDAAVQAVTDGGMICITSTDMPVLGGNHPETCFYRYGGTPLKAKYVHEMSLRLLLNATARAAARVQRYVEPLISCSIDFYVRIIVRIHDSPVRAKKLASTTALVYQCIQCDYFCTQPLGDIAGNPGNPKYKPARVTAPSQCPECGGRFSIGGPFYNGPLFNEEFVQEILQICEHESLPGVTSWKKVKGMATAISEELPDQSLFYTMPGLCSGLKLLTIPMKKMRSALNSLGYSVSCFHREPQALKTDAPTSVVFDLLRLWQKKHPVKKCPFPQILEKECKIKEEDIEWDAEDSGPKPKMARFLPNPAPNWGPKPRANPHGPASSNEKEKIEEKAEKAEIQAANNDENSTKKNGENDAGPAEA